MNHSELNSECSIDLKTQTKCCIYSESPIDDVKPGKDLLTVLVKYSDRSTEMKDYTSSMAPMKEVMVLR